jgi:hypothetical protein
MPFIGDAGQVSNIYEKNYADTTLRIVEGDAMYQSYNPDDSHYKLITTLADVSNVGATTVRTIEFGNVITGFTTTTKAGIVNTEPIHTLDVGSNVYIDDAGTDKIVTTGPVKADQFKGESATITNSVTTRDVIVDRVYAKTNGSIDVESNVGILNTAPVHTLDIGANVQIDEYGSNTFYTSGNVYAEHFKSSNITVSGGIEAPDFIVDDINPRTTHFVNFTSNVGVLNTAPVHTLDIGANVQIDEYGSNTFYTSGNVYAEHFKSSNVTVSGGIEAPDFIVDDINPRTTDFVNFTSNVGVLNTAPVHTLDIGANVQIDEYGSNTFYTSGNVHATKYTGEEISLTGVIVASDFVLSGGSQAVPTPKLQVISEVNPGIGETAFSSDRTMTLSNTTTGLDTTIIRSITAYSNIIGDNVTAVTTNSNLIGDNVTAVTVNSNLIGDNVTAVTVNSNLIGDNVVTTTITALTTNSNVVGDNVTAVTVNSNLIGDNVVTTTITALTTNSNVVGDNVTAVTVSSNLIGDNVTAVTVSSNLIGDNVVTTTITALTTNSNVVGDNVTAVTTNSNLIGDNVTAMTVSSNLIGDNVVTTTITALTTNSNVVADNVNSVTIRSNLIGNNVITTNDITGGTTLYVKESTKRVGINKSNPTKALDVTGEIECSSDLTVGGDLVVNGVTTTVNTTTLSVQDKIIEIGKDNTSGTTDLGIIMSRPTSNVAIFYNEGVDKLQIGHTTSLPSDSDITLDASNKLDVNIQGDLDVGTSNLYVDVSASRVGILTSTPGYTLDVRGTANVGAFTATSGNLSGDLVVDTNTLKVNSSTNRVGILTTAPGFTLDVRGTANVGAFTATTIAGNGASITAINAGNITTGILSRPIDTSTGVFTGDVTISGSAFIGSSTRGLKSVTGSYGTVQTTGAGAGNYEGYSIDGRYVFMSADNNACGIYNDLDNEWMIYCARNAGTRLYYNGAQKLETNNGGVTVTGTVSATAGSFTGQIYTTGAFYTDGNRSVIRGGSPTLYFRDTDGNSAMIHNNGNLLYVLRGGNDTETWSQVNSQWPWIFNLANNDSTCGGNLYVNGGTVTATTFSGNATSATTAGTCTGNAASADTAAACSGNAATATKVYATGRDSTNSTHYLTFVDSHVNGNRSIYQDNGLTYNPSTGTITATTFSGNATSASQVNNSLTPGAFLTGSSFNGSTARTFAVDATSGHTGDKVMARDSSGDTHCRLFRSTYQNQSTISGAIAYRVSTSDNYIRFCSDKGAIRGFLDVPTRTGGSASGTWGINITGSSASCTGNSATATTAAACTGNSATASAVTGKSSISKTALTAGANDYHLELYSGNTGNANKEISLRFHQGSQWWYSMRVRAGGFYFTDGASSTTVPMTASQLTLTGTWQAGSYYRLMGYNTGKQIHFSYNDGTWVSDNNKILFGVGGTQASGTGVYTERMRIANNGYVGVNQTNPTYMMHVNGSMYYAGGGNYGSDDRIKYNEQNVSNALTLISQLQPQKYEKIVEVPRSAEGHWIPTDEEWENVKDEYEYDNEYGFIAQDVRNIPELSFLVTGEETRTDTKIITLEEYSNLATEQQNTYSLSYVNDESAVITPGEYSNLTPEESDSYSVGYTKQFETETPLGLNYNGIFVVAVAAIQELKSENDTLKSQLASVLARLDALENA